uniref:Uncharacterized protein n=1 Tax=Tanacetum cinerariifolium TaxID=118510 RepID=A0A6L2KBN0_TANCI|nr:hypothetical protein [Tanacetum cinerariifolium]
MLNEGDESPGVLGQVDHITYVYHVSAPKALNDCMQQGFDVNVKAMGYWHLYSELAYMQRHLHSIATLSAREVETQLQSCIILANLCEDGIVKVKDFNQELGALSAYDQNIPCKTKDMGKYAVPNVPLPYSSGIGSSVVTLPPC